MFVATSILLSRQTRVVATKVSLLRQNLNCDKITFVATKAVVATKLCLSQQKTCFVATNKGLLRQKLYLCQLPPAIVNDDEEDE